MKGLAAFSCISQIDLDLIEESAILSETVVGRTESRGRKLLTGAMIFLGSGWCVTAACAVVAVGVLLGIIWLGRQAGGPPLPPVGSLTDTTAESEAPTEEPNEAETPPVTEEQTEPVTEGILHPEITEGGITFVSLGDGTCKIKGADPTVEGHVTVPAASPYGDVVTTVATGAFKGFRSVTSVRLPETVTVIKSSAFQGCKALRQVDLPPEVTEFGKAMFDGCGELTSVVLPHGVTEIPAMTFQTCVNLRSVEYRGDVITSIGANAFNGCRSLSELTIPGGLESIGSSAFQNCCGLYRVCYGGTAAEWRAVEISPTNNGYILSVNVVYGGG